MNNKAELIRLCEKYEPHLPFTIEITERTKLTQVNKTDVQVIFNYKTDKKRLEDESDWLHHEVNCLSVKKMRLESEFPDKIEDN